eukprot:scaffold19272_cov129-Isochrysis_galbana.AAC.2
MPDHDESAEVAVALREEMASLLVPFSAAVRAPCQSGPRVRALSSSLRVLPSSSSIEMTLRMSALSSSGKAGTASGYSLLAASSGVRRFSNAADVRMRLKSAVATMTRRNRVDG